MELVKLTYSTEFKRVLSECCGEIVGKILARLEGNLFFIEYNNIDVVPSSDRVSFTAAKGNKVELKIGRFLNKLFVDTGICESGSKFTAETKKSINYHTAHDVERFVYLWKGFANFEEMSKSFDLVAGEDIRKFYHHKSYEKGGSLGSSCMRYDNCQEFLDIYCLNSEQIKLLVLKTTNGTIKGRAIIWNNIELTNVNGSKEIVTLME